MVQGYLFDDKVVEDVGGVWRESLICCLGSSCSEVMSTESVDMVILPGFRLANSMNKVLCLLANSYGSLAISSPWKYVLSAPVATDGVAAEL